MVNEPPLEILTAMPEFYETEEVEVDDKIVHLHFYIGRCNWYAAEFDGEDLFFGYVNLNDPINAEWGYFSLKELRDLAVGTTLRLEAEGQIAELPMSHEIAWDDHWQPIRFGDLREGGFL